MFENIVRVRVNGILTQENRLLLVKINSPTKPGSFWMPPGGGLEFGESLETALKREMLEETGLIVETENLLYVSEYLKSSWHAVEFYFRCRKTGGALQLGSDPELNDKSQMLEDIGWFSAEESKSLELFPAFIRRDFEKLIANIDGPTQFLKP